jgi:hypothetical protein
MFGQTSAQTPAHLHLDPPDTFRSFDGSLQIGHRLMQVEEDLGGVLDLRRHDRELGQTKDVRGGPKWTGDWGDRAMSGSVSHTRSME